MDAEPGEEQTASDEALMLDIYPALRRFAAIVAPAEVSPDDLVHDAFVELLARGRLDNVNDVQAYLRRSMLNLASNHRRRLGRARRAMDRLRSEATAVTVDSYPSDLAHLATLRPEARAVLYLHHVEGKPSRVIAGELGLSDITVRKIASRARRALRDHIDGQEG